MQFKPKINRSSSKQPCSFSTPVKKVNGDLPEEGTVIDW